MDVYSETKVGDSQDHLHVTYINIKYKNPKIPKLQDLHKLQNINYVNYLKGKTTIYFFLEFYPTIQKFESILASLVYFVQ